MNLHGKPPVLPLCLQGVEAADRTVVTKSVANVRQGHGAAIEPQTQKQPHLRSPERSVSDAATLLTLTGIKRRPRERISEPAEDAIARMAVSLTGKERACTLLFQIGESFDAAG